MSSTFTTRTEGDVFIVQIPKPFDAAAIDGFNEQMNNWLLQPAEIYIFDFAGHDKLSPRAYRPIIVLNQVLTKNQRHLACLGFSQLLVNQLVADGVCGAFCPVGSVAEAKAKFGKPDASIDTRFIKPFVDATVKTLSVQASTQSHPGKPFVLDRTAADGGLGIDIAGVISLTSDTLKGNITIGFPAAVFLKIYENMFGEKVTALTPEIQDAAGEILNIIYGSAKTELNATQGCGFKPALPTVLTGEKLNIRQSPLNPTIVLPFETLAGPFQIEVTVEKL
jgi:chemotaxis protein CheX